MSDGIVGGKWAEFGVSTQRCCRCKQTKNISEFHKNSPRCKSCSSEISKAMHQRRKLNPVVPIETKTCPACDETKPASKFYLLRVGKDGLSGLCKECTKIRDRRNRAKRKDRIPTFPTSGFKICTKCKESKPVDAFHLNRVSNDGLVDYCRPCCRKTAKSNYLKRTYGITYEEYKAMEKKQKGRCAICKNRETLILHGKKARLSIDHCHITGKLRGLLCNTCNVATGYLQMLVDKNLLEPALAYLRKHGAID
jgi:hypothetical protein